MYGISSGDGSDFEPMSMDMLEVIRDDSQSHLIINSRGAYHKIRNCIKQGQAEWKEALLSTRNMSKGLHKVFKAVVNEILQDLPILGEYGSEVYYFVP